MSPKMFQWNKNGFSEESNLGESFPKIKTDKSDVKKSSQKHGDKKINQKIWKCCRSLEESDYSYESDMNSSADNLF